MRNLICWMVILASIGFGNWELSPIVSSSPGDLIECSIAVDSLNLPQVAFGRYQGLGYARWTRDSWKIEYPETGIIVREVELCLDADELPHIGYRGGSDVPPYPKSVRYAYWDGDTWHIETVARNAVLSSLVLARDRTPHMVFVDSLQALKYAYKAGDTWNILTVPAYQADTLRRRGNGSLALDTSDRPGIAVAWGKPDAAGPSRDSMWLSFLGYDGQNWHRFDVDSAEGWGVWDFWRERVQYDPTADLFHVVYRYGAYATGKGNNWQVEEANVSVGNWWYGFALHQGRPHIACSSSWDPLEYQWRWVGGWESEQVVNEHTDAVSIAVDRTGMPHIALFAPFTLFYARRLFVGTEEPAPTIVYPKLRLLVHPNPALGDFTVQYGVPVKGRVKLLLYDAQGRVKAVVRDEETNPGYYRQVIGKRASALPAGVYFLALAQDGNRVTRKAVLAE